MIKIFLTDLARYNGGELHGEWVTLPCDMDETIERICGDNEYFITDYETDIPGLKIDEYTYLGDLNEMAEMLETLDDWRMDDLAAIMYVESDLDKALEILNSGDYSVRYNIDSEYDLGYELAEDYGILQDMPEHLKNYFDFEKYGRDCTFEGWTIIHEIQAAVCLY